MICNMTIYCLENASSVTELKLISNGNRVLLVRKKLNEFDLVNLRHPLHKNGGIVYHREKFLVYHKNCERKLLFLNRIVLTIRTISI